MRITVYTDGGARPNPGEAAYGVLVLRAGSVITGTGRYLGPHKTNNYAEYSGVIDGLRQILVLVQGTSVKTRFTLDCSLYTDSEVVVKHISGEYAVRSDDLKPLYAHAKELIHEIVSLGASIAVKHVPRLSNSIADQLVRKARDVKDTVTLSIDYSTSSKRART